MKIVTLCAAAALILSATTSASAADSNKALVTVDYTDTIAPADAQAYETGVKAYNECLHAHGVKFDEYAVNHETGRNTYKISYDAGPMTWAQQDELEAESRPCDATFHTQVNPHLQSESGAFMLEEPEMSHLPAGTQDPAPPQVLHILNYTLQPGHAASVAFTDAVKKIAAAAAKAKWPYYWDTVAIEGGGEGAPDYQLAIGGKDWSAMGRDPDPSLWKMVAGVYGPSDANAIRKSLDDSIKSSSDHFDRYNASLSYIAGK